MPDSTRPFQPLPGLVALIKPAMKSQTCPDRPKVLMIDGADKVEQYRRLGKTRPEPGCTFLLEAVTLPGPFKKT